MVTFHRVYLLRQRNDNVIQNTKFYNIAKTLIFTYFMYIIPIKKC